MECSKCNKLFDNEFNLKRHFKNNPECWKKIEYTCPKCDKIFKDKTKFTIHCKTLKCSGNVIRKKCEDKDVQVNIYDMKYIKNLEKKIEKQEEIIKNFIPIYIQNFMNFIYFNIEIENIDNCVYNEDSDDNKNIIIKNIVIFLNNMSDNILHDFFSLFIKKCSKLNQKKVYLFYLIIKKNLNMFKNKEQVNLWNSRIYNEINKGKPQNEKIEVQFE